MNYEGYPVAARWDDKIEYTFISEGPKGRIPFVVQFTKAGNNLMYNLGFGIRNEDGTINDQIVNNNKDRNKILGTIGRIIYDFTVINPNKLIFFYGSTPERTRLYRMALTLNLSQLAKDFHIYGVLNSGNDFAGIPFQKGVDYFGFMIKRKKLNLKYEKDKEKKADNS